MGEHDLKTNFSIRMAGPSKRKTPPVNEPVTVTIVKVTRPKPSPTTEATRPPLDTAGSSRQQPYILPAPHLPQPLNYWYPDEAFANAEAFYAHIRAVEQAQGLKQGALTKTRRSSRHKYRIRYAPPCMDEDSEFADPDPDSDNESTRIRASEPYWRARQKFWETRAALEDAVDSDDKARIQTLTEDHRQAENRLIEEESWEETMAQFTSAAGNTLPTAEILPITTATVPLPNIWTEGALRLLIPGLTCQLSGDTPQHVPAVTGDGTQNAEK